MSSVLFIILIMSIILSLIKASRNPSIVNTKRLEDNNKRSESINLSEYEDSKI